MLSYSVNVSVNKEFITIMFCLLQTLMSVRKTQMDVSKFAPTLMAPLSVVAVLDSDLAVMESHALVCKSLCGTYRASA